MAYSNKRVPNDTRYFPPPQRWMSWVDDATFEYERNKDGSLRVDANGGYVYRLVPTGEGTIRYYYTLSEARKKLNWIGSKSKYSSKPGFFRLPWALYEWVDDAWVLRFSGEHGEERKYNPLWLTKLENSAHPILKAQENATIESILKAASA